MATDRWARAHQTTLTLDGAERPVEIVRLRLGEMTNVKLWMSMLSLQNTRLALMADTPVMDQIEASKTEAALNLHLGGCIEQTIRESLRPAAPWLASSEVMVTDGASYVEAYGNDDLLAAFLAVYLANTIGVTTRKNSPSPRDLDAGSAPSETGAPGDAQEPTAAPVDAKTSAVFEVVSVPLALSPSGTTDDRLSPSPVLSAV